MRINLRWAALLCAALLFSVAGVALADDVSNNLDGSIDATAEVMPLTLGGADGSTELYVTPRNGDSDNGCNLQGTDETLVIQLSTGNPSVATVSPSVVTFKNCGDRLPVTVTPVGAGSANISATLVSNNSGGTFNLAPVTFTVDVTAPVRPNTAPAVAVTGFAAGQSFELGRDTLPTPGCSATDAEDGPSSPAPSINTSGLDAHGLGLVNVTCSVTDQGGLQAIASQVYAIVDTTDPAITLDSRTAADWMDWNKGDVTVTWTCFDAGSGVVSESVSTTLSDEGKAQTATGTCADNAGHTVSDTVTGINIDKSAPAIQGTRSPAPVDGWNNTDVTVHFECADALSGIASCPDDTTLGEGADQSVSGTATDNVGHSADATVSGINVDKTAPRLALVGGPADGGRYYWGSVPAAPACEASDALSGLDGQCSVTGYGTGLGAHTLTSSVTDKAGNTTTVERSYTVQAWSLNGFYSPVDMNGVVNTVKGGSTVPLKFEVFAGSELTDTSAVSSIKSAEYTCTSAPTDELEATATGGTVLRYDSAAGQFVYNWQTPKTAGRCYRLTMTTQDGSSLVALFKTK